MAFIPRLGQVLLVKVPVVPAVLGGGAGRHARVLVNKRGRGHSVVPAHREKIDKKCKGFDCEGMGGESEKRRRKRDFKTQLKDLQ